MRRPRILITRTRHQASELAAALEDMGAETILIPTIEVAPPTSFESLDAAIDTLSDPANQVDWIIFTSGNAVEALMERTRERRAVLHTRRIAAIGPATARAIQQVGLTPELAPLLIAHEFLSEALAEDLLAQAGDSLQHFLLVRAEEAREVLPGVLQAAGHTVSIASAYRNINPITALPALRQLFSSAEYYPDAITFTSSSTARNLVALLETAGHTIPPPVAIASIGPITSGTLRSLGHEPTFEAAQPTVDSLAAAIAAHLKL